jgi:dihydropteroate synthase
MDPVEVGDFAVGSGHRPRIMGVLNMSVESNYDPSVRGTPEDAKALAEEMAEQGADIIDIGLQSANPKNDFLAEEKERERLSAALSVVQDADVGDAVFSIETRFSRIAEEAIAGGFDLVNDICGFADPRMPDVCADNDVPVVKMASPQDITKPGHLRTIDDVFEALQRGGFTDRTIVDPAFGGWYDEKTYEDNWEMFRRLREFRAFDRPILTATNREDFLGDIAGRAKTENQLAVSLAAATMEVERGADIIRTHDVPETRDVALVADFLGDPREVSGSPPVAELTGVTASELERNRSVATETVGRSDDGASLVFKLGTLGEAAEDHLVECVRGHDLFVTQSDSGQMIAGPARIFAQAVEEISEGPPPLGEVAGVIRRALNRPEDLQ